MPRSPPALDFHQRAGEDRSEQRSHREIDEVDDARGGTAMLRPVGFLDHRVRDHRGAGRDPGQQRQAIWREQAGRREQDQCERAEQDQACTNDDRLATADPVGQPAKQRTADDPAGRHCRRAQDGDRIGDVVCLLQEPYPPDHVEYGRRDEQQASDQPAQDGLRVDEHGAHGPEGGPEPGTFLAPVGRLRASG